MEQASQSTFRSVDLLDRKRSALLVIDVQEKLLPHIENQNTICENIATLLKGARILQVPYAITEQYPKGLGHTVASLTELILNESNSESNTVEYGIDSRKTNV